MVMQMNRLIVRLFVGNSIKVIWMHSSELRMNTFNNLLQVVAGYKLQVASWGSLAHNLIYIYLTVGKPNKRKTSTFIDIAGPQTESEIFRDRQREGEG